MILLYNDLNIKPGYSFFFREKDLSQMASETYKLGDLSYADILFVDKLRYDKDYNYFIERFIGEAKRNRDTYILDRAIARIKESKSNIIPIEKFLSLVWGDRLVLGSAGSFEEFKNIIEQLDINRDNLFPYYLLVGDFDKARELGDGMLRRVQIEEKHKKNALPYIYGTFYALLLFKSGDPKLQKRALTVARASMSSYSKISSDSSYFDYLFADLVERFIYSKLDNTPLRTDDLKSDDFSKLLCNIISYWNGTAIDKENNLVILEHCAANGDLYDRLEFEVRAMGSTLSVETPESSSARYEELGRKGLPSLTRILSPIERWEDLVALLESGIEEKKEKSTVTESRLIWRVFIEDELYVPYIQKRGKRGWTKAKETKISTLKRKIPEFATIQDINMLSAFVSYSYGGTYVDNEKIWKAMIGHPNIYTIPELVYVDESIDIVSEKVELVINETSKGIEVGTTRRLSAPNLHMVDQTRFVVFVWNDMVMKVARMVEESGCDNGKGRYITIPVSEKNRVASVISNLGDEVAIDGSFQDPNIKSVRSENRLIVRAVPNNDTVNVTFLIKPIKGSSVTNIPGNGESIKILYISESKERVRLERDLAQEQEEVSKLILDIPSLSAMESGEFFTTLYGEIAILEFLSEMKERRNDIDIEWPKGERFRISNIISNGNISVDLSTAKEWFSLSGSVDVDQDKVLSLRELIQLSEGGIKPFIKLDDNTYIKLKRDLMHRISNLSIADRGRDSDSAVKIHRLGVKKILIPALFRAAL